MTTIEDLTSQYGLVQKIDAFGYMKYLAENPDAPRKHGKVVLVTADTPLKASRGEGKTTTTIALIDALNKRGIDATAVLRQPSMGITAAGSKGGASGGGKASLTHPELIDWGLCGEMAAIAAAQAADDAAAGVAVPETFKDYLDKWVYSVKDHDELLDKIGGARLMRLKNEPHLGYSTRH